MNGETRRKKIITILSSSPEPINATKLADTFSVTRQIIVADIALLRAAGHPIRSEHRGYTLEIPHTDGLLRKIVCEHDRTQTLDEFYAIVDNGGGVLDVEVEHSVYGLISASLVISSRYDAEEFVRKVSAMEASQLSDLTGGVHIHTIRVPDESSYARICQKLRDLGILVSED